METEDPAVLEKEKEKSRKSSIKDGSFFSVMDGLTSSYISPFAIALNASSTMIGVLATLPSLIGAFFQLLIPKIMGIFKSRKMLIVAFATLHGLLWLPLLLVPYLFGGNLYIMLSILIFITIISSLINPLWNSMMADIVPEDDRGKYFGRRNKITNIVSFASALSAGLILQYHTQIFSFLYNLTGIQTFSNLAIDLYVGFAILFGIAFLARLCSAYYLGRMIDIEYNVKPSKDTTFFSFIKHMKETNYGKFTIYVAIIKFALFVASPFYAVYMLRYLGFNYIQFMAITVIGVLATFLSMEFWGKISDNYGSKNVLLLGGLLIGVGPLVWFFTSNFYVLVCFEFLSGISWAAFNLAASNFLLDGTNKANRIKYLSYFNVMIGIAIFAGAFFGARLQLIFPANINNSRLPYLFLISGLIRLLATIFFFKTLKEERLIEFNYKKEPLRIVTIRPSHTRLGQQLETIMETEKMDDVEEEIKEAHSPGHKKDLIKKELDKKVPTRTINKQSTQINAAIQKKDTRQKTIDKNFKGYMIEKSNERKKRLMK